jgi:hypothetical protein
MGQGNEETGTIVYKLTSIEAAHTAKEMQAIANENEDEQGPLQAIDSFVATTTASRNAEASKKVILKWKQAKGDQ